MPLTQIDLFQNGKWIKAPALYVNGTTLVVKGQWLKVAAVDAEECLERDLEDPGTFLQVLRDQADVLKVDLFTFAQKLPVTTPQYDYYFEWDSVAAFRLRTFSEWWSGLPQVTRKNARLSAKRGVVIRTQAVDDDLVHGIVAINDETPVRQGRRFTHFGEDFDKVKKDFLSFSERSDILCAYCGDELIGLTKIIYCGRIAAIMKLQTKISHYEKKAANGLIAKAIERCAERGADYVTYGQYRYGNQKHTSLMEFKTRHGFEEMRVPRYYVPLTLNGKVSTALKFHRGAVGLLPPAVLEFGRAVRSRILAGVAQR